MSQAPPSVSGSSEATDSTDATTIMMAIMSREVALGRSTIGGVSGITRDTIPTETQAQGGAAVAATTAETTTVETENATVNRLRMPRRKGLSANRPIIDWTKVMTANDVSILARGRENGDRHLVREQ